MVEEMNKEIRADKDASPRTQAYVNRANETMNLDKEMRKGKIVQSGKVAMQSVQDFSQVTVPVEE